MNYTLPSTKLQKAILCICYSIICLFFLSTKSQAQNGVIGSAFTDGWNNPTNIIGFENGAGNSRILITHPRGTGLQYFRLATLWAPPGGANDHTEWSIDSYTDPQNDVEVIPGTLQSVNRAHSYKAMYVNVENTSHTYILKTRSGGLSFSTTNNFVLLRIKTEQHHDAIRSISSLSTFPSTENPVDPGQEVTVSATIDGVFSEGQSVFLRYSTDNFVTSAIIEMTGSGTAYEAIIPGESHLFNSQPMKYYAFTSGAGLNINHNDVDLYTINRSMEYEYEIKGYSKVISVTNFQDEDIYPGQELTVTAILDFPFLENEQTAYLRYTIDNWASSTIIQMVKDENDEQDLTYTANIPGESNQASATIQYYIFTSSILDKETITHENADENTINLNNNNGPNYTFTVKNDWVTGVSGNWSDPATWLGGSIPEPTQPVRIMAPHTITIDVDITVSSLTIENGATLDATDQSIQFLSGGAFSNNGTFIKGTSTIEFDGVTTLNGTKIIDFHDVIITNECDFLNPSLNDRGRINGSLYIRSGAFVPNAPVFETNSWLIYDGGGTYEQVTEWDDATLQNVRIRNNTTLKLGHNTPSSKKSLAGNLIIDNGSALDMSLEPMSAALEIGGNLMNNGTLTLSSVSQGDLIIEGNFVQNGTFNPNKRAILLTGEKNQSLEGSGTALPLHFTIVDKPQGIVTFNRAITFDNENDICVFRITKGSVNFNNQDIIFGGSGTKFLHIEENSESTLQTGGSSITGFSFSNDTGSFTTLTNSLGGTVEFNGTSGETIPAATYENLVINGNNITLASSGTINILKDFHADPAINYTITGSTIRLNGDEQNIPEFTFHNLTIAGTNHKTLQGNITIEGTLHFENNHIFTSSNKVTLTNTGNISGEDTNHYVIGNLEVTRTVSGTPSDFGNIGVHLDPGTISLGEVTVLRNAGLPAAGSAVTDPNWHLHTGINRQWKITPQFQPGFEETVNLTLSWLSSENNGKDLSTAQVWKRSDGKTTWELPSGTSSIDITAPSITLTGLDSFSEFTVSDDGNPLPVILKNFNGQVMNQNQAYLKWTTSQEKNNYGFEIQKSHNGKDFFSIGFIEGHHTSLQPQHYQFTDNSFAFMAYYRLKQIDHDGSYAYHNIIAIIDQNNIGNMITVYPNPTTGPIHIFNNSNVENTQEVMIGLHTTDGRQILAKQGDMEEIVFYLNKIFVDLPTGVYLLKIHFPKTQIIKRIIKR
jgi:hypothetical protein